MKFATLTTGQVVAQTDDGGYRTVELAGAAGPASMIEVMQHYPSGLSFSGDPVDLPETLSSPIPAPSKIWAAASNYHRIASRDPDGRSGRGQSAGLSPEELLQSIFLKPPSAITGAGHSVIVPRGVGNVFPELELCIVIGRRSKDLSIEEAPSAIFGYTILLDMTARSYTPDKSGRGMRCIRKGYDTFAPVGPVIVTRDEIADPHALKLNLWVNGELRQSASTETMINRVPQLVSFLSGVSTLEPGDLIATGTPDSPAHQRELSPGDVMTAEIEGIGRLQLDVRAA